MKTILIIEDDVVFGRSIGNWLRKKGMDTAYAFGGPQGTPGKGVRPRPGRLAPA